MIIPNQLQKLEEESDGHHAPFDRMLLAQAEAETDTDTDLYRTQEPS